MPHAERRQVNSLLKRAQAEMSVPPETPVSLKKWIRHFCLTGILPIFNGLLSLHKFFL